jgi:hypothetical protein
MELFVKYMKILGVKGFENCVQVTDNQGLKTTWKPCKWQNAWILLWGVWKLCCRNVLLELVCKLFIWCNILLEVIWNRTRQLLNNLRILVLRVMTPRFLVGCYQNSRGTYVSECLYTLTEAYCFTAQKTTRYINTANLEIQLTIWVPHRLPCQQNEGGNNSLQIALTASFTCSLSRRCQHVKPM